MRKEDRRKGLQMKGYVLALLDGFAFAAYVCNYASITVSSFYATIIYYAYAD